ncbi:MAG: hypothetical protein Fur0032_20240 [Terrimicrobiaceae bacterium]
MRGGEKKVTGWEEAGEDLRKPLCHFPGYSAHMDAVVPQR